MTVDSLQHASAIEEHMTYARELRNQGGPDVDQYAEFTAWLGQLFSGLGNGVYDLSTIQKIRNALGDAFSMKTMQGFALHKPHGYAGDFEIIDKTYSMHVCADSRLANWDRYYHSTPAAQAVRNRKFVFHSLLREMDYPEGGERRVLNLASGPGRDIFEYLTSHPDTSIRFHCVEQDENAIQYARRLCASHIERVTFKQGNVVRFRPEPSAYDLIWAGGLFDYFNDRVFAFVLKRLYDALKPGGRVVIGNFSNDNPTQSYMHLLEWVIHHRSPEKLASLAQRAGIGEDRTRVTDEPAAVNLFLQCRAA